MVQSQEGIRVIIDHFERYPLLTKKRSREGLDFLLFKQVFNLIDKKEHLTLSGLHKILSIKASMNLGLPESLKAAFPNITPVQRPTRSVEELLNSNCDPY